jgi:hypothetical protein
MTLLFQIRSLMVAEERGVQWKSFSPKDLEQKPGLTSSLLMISALTLPWASLLALLAGKPPYSRALLPSPPREKRSRVVPLLRSVPRVPAQAPAEACSCFSLHLEWKCSRAVACKHRRTSGWRAWLVGISITEAWQQALGSELLLEKQSQGHRSLAAFTYVAGRPTEDSRIALRRVGFRSAWHVPAEPLNCIN